MRVLVIGGTGFIGTPLVRMLAARGHAVTVFHRGLHRPSLPAGVVPVHSPLAAVPVLGYPQTLYREPFDAVVHMTLLGERDAEAAVRAFRGRAGRLVVVSSGDVYAAYGGLLGLEPRGDGAPLPESAPLRAALFPYGRRVPGGPWGDLVDYDKILAERTAAAATDLPATILRLPMVYGPWDRYHRFFPWIRRMDDRRPRMILGASQARSRLTHGYVDNVAAAIALAATHPEAGGRTYNVGERATPTILERVRRLAEVAAWPGECVIVPDTRLPAHLRDPMSKGGDLVLDTERIRADLGYEEPVEASEGLARTIAWERQHPPEAVDPGQFDYASEDRVLASEGRLGEPGSCRP